MEEERKRTVFAISCAPYLSHIYDKQGSRYSSDQVTGYGYSYDELSLEEVVILSKTTSEAKDELIGRLSGILYRYATYGIHHYPSLDFESLYQYLCEISLKAAEIYKPNKDSFMHLLRSMLKFELMRESLLIHKQQQKDLRYFGRRVQDAYKEETLFCDSASADADMTSKIALKVDCESYIAKQSIPKQQIFRMYIYGYRLKEIASTLDMKISTVSFHVNKMLKELRNLEYPESKKKEMPLHQSEKERLIPSTQLK